MNSLSPRRRTLLLILALAALLLGTLTRRFAGWSPFASRNRALNAAGRKLDGAQGRAAEIEWAQAHFDEARRRSLPPDPSRAATMYHAWLIETLEASGHQDVALTPGRIGHEHRDFSRLPFTVESLCTGDSLSVFLDQFYGSGLLHKVVSIHLRSDEVRSDLLRSTIDLEALALKDAEPRDSLILETVAAATSQPPGNPLRAALQRDPFRLADLADREAPQSPPEFEPVQEPDRRSETLLIATYQRNGVPEAWLYDRTLQTQHVLKNGEHNELLGTDSRMLAIRRDRIEFEVQGKQFRLDLGQSLSQATAVAP